MPISSNPYVIPRPYDFMEDKRGDFEEYIEQ